MKNQKSNPNFHQWMIIVDDNIAGYVRIKENDIGIMVGENYQNLGIGTIGLRLAEQKAKDLGITKLIALIQEDNLSSQHSFEKNDYKLKMLWFEKDLN